MHKSEHVKERQQQRCINNDAINLVLRYGKVLRRVGGCETLGFPRKLNFGCLMQPIASQRLFVKLIIPSSLCDVQKRRPE